MRIKMNESTTVEARQSHPELVDVEGTIANVLKQNKDEIERQSSDRSISLNAMKQNVIGMINDLNHTPAWNRTASTIMAQRSKDSLLLFLWNVIMKAQNQGVIH